MYSAQGWGYASTHFVNYAWRKVPTMQCESGRRRATRETLQQKMITMLRKIKPESRTSGVSYNKILNLEHQVFERERYMKKDPPHRRKMAMQWHSEETRG